jgi:hypothetical protein
MNVIADPHSTSRVREPVRLRPAGTERFLHDRGQARSNMSVGRTIELAARIVLPASHQEEPYFQ